MEVTIWQEQITLPTYKTGKPDKNPMFFEKRVYQGSSGVVYPNPVIEKIEDEKVDQEYTALFIENKYIKIMILPEIGGRVHMAYDKIADRHFIYYNQVIKPALVGLCGPWISGGIEFNWPQHHRPSTFETIDYKIEENADGSKTVWVNEIEKMFRTRGMAGFTLHPDKAYLEIKAQLYNRTTMPQTFLWWANPAVKVNDNYQTVFPPDVHAVFDHGRRDVSDFPIATGTYYKVDYSPGTDISRYKNIPVPTSYMAVDSKYNFVGGYEHDTRAGVMHVADHHVSPGKKQWTWGNGDFGIAWDRNLTDEDGPYIELMTGVYTDNQPDFSWIMPSEEKTFTQYFLPYRELGIVKNASKDILIGFEKQDDKLLVKIFATSAHKNITVLVKHQQQTLMSEVVDVSPEHIFERSITVPNNLDINDTEISVLNDRGRELLSYQPEKSGEKEVPQPAKPATLPADTETNEQLFLIGQHLEQYRHATYNPVDYYEEALKRDPTDLRCNNALGALHLRKGQFAKSEPYLREAIAKSIRHNPNPYDCEPYYNLGLVLNYLDKRDEAYEAFFKATWSSAWQDSAYFAVAQIDLIRGDYEVALEHIDWAIDRNARNSKAYLVKVHALRMLDKTDEAIATAQIALKRDGFNYSLLYELYHCYKNAGNNETADNTLKQFLTLSRRTSNNLIETAIEYAAIGLYGTAVDVLGLTSLVDEDSMVNYYIAYYLSKADDDEQSLVYLKKAAEMSPDYCFPNRLEDILVLQYAQEKNAADAKVPYYLGNLWYDKRQYADAVASWSKSAALDGSFATVWRNLAIAAFNKEDDGGKALTYFERAYSINPADARVLMELDQLYKRLNYPTAIRYAFLQDKYDVTILRDDTYLEFAALTNFKGDHKAALGLIMSRQFHPWEGGEGKASGQYVYSLVELAKLDLQQNNYQAAIEKLQRAQQYPESLGEGKLYGAQENDIFYWLGCAYEGLQELENAKLYWDKAKIGLSEPSAAMFYNDQQPDKIFYQGLAWCKLDKVALANKIFQKLVDYGKAHEHDHIRIDFFAVSLPDLMIFDDDLDRRNYIHCNYITGLGFLGLGKFEEAAAAFEIVLQEDAMHFGAKTHLKLLTAMQQQAA